MGSTCMEQSTAYWLVSTFSIGHTAMVIQVISQQFYRPYHNDCVNHITMVVWVISQ